MTKRIDLTVDIAKEFGGWSIHTPDTLRVALLEKEARHLYEVWRDSGTYCVGWGKLRNEKGELVEEFCRERGTVTITNGKI